MHMRYYRLLDDMRSADRWFLKGPIAGDGLRIDPAEFLDATTLAYVEPLLIPVRRPGKSMDFTLGDFDMPVLRKAFADAVERVASNEVQMFAARVEGDAGEFAVMNARAARNCLDQERSHVEVWAPQDGEAALVGKYKTVSKLVVKPDEIGGLHVCRVTGWESALIVSEDILAVMSTASGATFEPVSHVN
jgi:hypothetical protein